MSKRISYKLTLEIDEYGQRSFSAASDSDDQGELADSLAFDIHRMLGIMNTPPSDASIVRAMNSDTPGRYDLLAMVALLYRFWTLENRIQDCIRLTVDVDKLCHGDDEERLETVRHHLRHCGFASEETATTETVK